MTAPAITHLEPLAGPLPDVEIPLYSRWRHVEGEEVVVIGVEEDAHKDTDGSWVDLIVYGVPKLQAAKTRTRANFLERFVPLVQDLRGRSWPQLEALEDAVAEFLDNHPVGARCGDDEGFDHLECALKAARGER